jgi:predicted metal-dependent hydrolase
MDFPDYTIRESAKAKNVNLRLSVDGQLEVVVPRGFDRAEIPSILTKHQRWIERASNRMAQRQPQAPNLAATTIPSQIDLRAVGQNWLVEYTPAPVTSIRFSELDDCVILWGNTEDEALCKLALQKWLTRQATRHFSPWLTRLSQETGLPFKQVSFRGQRTRWGSCSCEKNISLNYKLLFLPAPLVHYVLIHELCHTVHLDHSARFWKLVGQKEPDYRRLDRELNEAMSYVPRWV